MTDEQDRAVGVAIVVIAIIVAVVGAFSLLFTNVGSLQRELDSVNKRLDEMNQRVQKLELKK